MENVESLYPEVPTLEDLGYVKVACRLCGEVWSYPPEMAKQFDSEHGFECMYCKRIIRLRMSGCYMP